MLLSEQLSAEFLMKMRIGKKVRLTKGCIEWYQTHLVETFRKPPEGIIEDTDAVAMWATTHIDPPVGRVLKASPWKDMKGKEFKVRFENSYGSDEAYFSVKKDLK